MGINITQFAPPGTVSKLVWDDDMKPGAGKIFKGDLAGNVTGDVAGDVTGDVSGYILRDYTYTTNPVDTLVIPASTGELDYYIPNPIFSGGLFKGAVATNDGSMHLTASSPASYHHAQIYVTCYDASEVQLMTDTLEAQGAQVAKDVVIPQATKHIVITSQKTSGSVSSSAIYCKL